MNDRDHERRTEAHRAASRRWYYSNGEWVKTYYLDNKERVKERTRLWREANRERLLDYNREYNKKRSKRKVK